MKGRQTIGKAGFAPLSKEGRFQNSPKRNWSMLFFLRFKRKRYPTFKYLEYIIHFKVNSTNHLEEEEGKIDCEQVLFVVLNETNYNEYPISNEFRNSPLKNCSVLYKKEESDQTDYLLVVGQVF
jgi:hypothetical protein